MQPDWRDRLATLGPPRRPADAEAGDLPERTWWHQRPALWPAGTLAPVEAAGTGHSLCPGLTLHHDSATGPSLALRDGQLCIGLAGVSGRFVSLALALPAEVARALGRHDIIRLAGVMTPAARQTVFARLNLVHGPNSEALPHEIADPSAPFRVEWDLSFTGFEPDRARDAWIDLILEAPFAARVEVADLTALVHPRRSFL